MLAPYRILVRPVVGGLSQTLEVVGGEKYALSASEQESGTLAFSSLVYFYGAELHPLWLVALWSASVAMPRTAMILQDRRERLEAKKLVQGNPAQTTLRAVNPAANAGEAPHTGVPK